MSDLPLVTVCIPVYNRSLIIGHTLASVLGQTYSNLEIIVSDNASTDDTVDVVKRHANGDSRIRLLQLPENRGPVENWKHCQRHAKGEFVKYLWSDDYIDPDFIEKAVRMFDEKTGFVYGPVKWYDTKSFRLFPGKGFVRHRHVSLDSGAFVNAIVLSDSVPVSGTSAVFRKSVIDELFSHPYPECSNVDFGSTGAGVDALMYLYSADRYPFYGYISDSFSYYGYHSDGITVKEGERLYPYYFCAYLSFLLHGSKYLGIVPRFRSRLLFYETHVIRLEPIKKQVHDLFSRADAWQYDRLFYFQLIMWQSVERAFSIPGRVFRRITRNLVRK